jgi:hypothetical protein
VAASALAADRVPHVSEAPAASPRAMGRGGVRAVRLDPATSTGSNVAADSVSAGDRALSVPRVGAASAVAVRL